MSHAYTEDQLVEQPAIGLFVELGWAVAGPPPHAGIAGEPRDAGVLGRETKGEVVLVSRLRTALERLNASRMGHHVLTETVLLFIPAKLKNVRMVGDATRLNATQATELMQIQNLRRTYELLLPRLLSGHMELKTEAA